MKNQPMNSRFHHSPASLFVLSTKSTGVIAAVSVGLAAAAHPYGARLSHGGLLLSVGALQCCWLGANMAISFFEAPVKFLAPTPARRTLIDVGRHVFSAFNKVEVALAAFDLLGWYLITQRGLINSSGSAFTTTTTSGSGTIRSSSFFTGLRQLSAHQWVFRFAPSLIVFVFESFGFLPVLRDVGARYIEGRPVETKRVHGIYVLLEVVKVATLAVSTLRVGKTLLKML
ncbi:hypothetical protein BCR41DRAFT_346242 [Lobosporangium transversale]|uniref:Uncharacterized protein n=1 Tax=Lobosporangium transversale TaxID=64571 RepID=A0A1Y2H031_9FUNG|nr:hypothetical protein BCR41DRAFT_346242 [Lobosporangium transversale]ORZ27918.1 hypothetical protein BCR41DRAFT_346242 [Lobosporangium transversale]|eukprot:XP_021885621.1 hypothetical protein BCR41DRAFT_346242 [Lobosporangium transversale]